MNILTETTPSTPATPQLGASIVDDAIAALAPFRPGNREQIVTLLGAWSRSSALNVYDVVAVQNHFFPVKLVKPPACPAWCDGEHRSENDSIEFRDCMSPDVLIPARVSSTQITALQVNAIRTFDKTTGKLSRPMVQLEDYDFTAREARDLAHELLRVADLIDG